MGTIFQPLPQALGRAAFPTFLGATLTGRTIDTDADGTIAALSAAATFTKNDTNTRAFYVAQNKPVFNFGASNTNTTVHVDSVDTTNTAVTGITTSTSTLWRRAYGGTARAYITLDGQLFNSVEGGFNPVFVRTSNNTGGISHAMVKGRGTNAAPRRAQSGDVLGGQLMTGYYAVDDATDATYDIAAASANLRAVTLEAFTSTARGAYLQMQTAPVGSTTLTTRAMVSTTGLSLGSTLTARGTTEPTNALNIFDGTAPVGTLTNGISLYSTAGELRVMDAAGNATLLSPHDKTTNEWIYDSVLSTTGKRLRIDVERMLRVLDAQLGGGYIHES